MPKSHVFSIHSIFSASLISSFLISSGWDVNGKNMPGLLNVIVREGMTILKLLASEDKALLVGRNTLLVMNLCLDIVNGHR